MKWCWECEHYEEEGGCAFCAYQFNVLGFKRWRWGYTKPYIPYNNKACKRMREMRESKTK